MSQPIFSEIEEQILKFWEENKIFEKSVSKPAPKGDFVFYDGPPFATGTPHYGHIVASLMKDVVPRYWTMKGYRVERVWGWDCHGLPIENIVEKELRVQTKKEIEQKVGIDKFNETCRSKVLTYADEWKKFIPRMGRWVDMENAYKTMDLPYMESIWWVFKQLWGKGLIYEDYKSMRVCPRCETTLSQSEVSEGYKDVNDLSVVAKFLVHSSQFTEPTYLLAWTTTPWTLAGNIALAVGWGINYLKVKISNEFYILAKDTVEQVLQGRPYTVAGSLKGKDLVGISYEPLFPYFDKPDFRQKGFRVYAADFVSTEEGTGIVHIAPAFGEDDMHLGKARGLPWIQHVTMDGRFTKEVVDFALEHVKPADDPRATDRRIIQWLEERDKLFLQKEHTHSYPHCWRCETPLLNYATSSWFVKVSAIKKRMIKLAEKIHWVPEHIKEGRFGKWLEGAEDWSISRQRFWGSVLPIWKCENKCGEFAVFGSIAELEAASGAIITDLHKHTLDKITFNCKKCSGLMSRVPDVLDCWFESGSMPYAQFHYPFENKKKFEDGFPAQFIAEGVDQTRCWFYYLLALSTALMNDAPFLNVIANGIVLAEDGQKMAKRLKNYPDPSAVINKYGADALRYYLLTSPVMKADTVNFSEKGVDEANKKVVALLLNVLSFYKIYAPPVQHNTECPAGHSVLDDLHVQHPVLRMKSKHILDRWIIARLHELIRDTTKAMDDYDLVLASRPIAGFVNDLSTWYLRRSRDKFKSVKKRERSAALRTTNYVLRTLAQVMAPFMPFLAEHVWQELGCSFRCSATDSPLPSNGMNSSVHLSEWPKFKKSKIDTDLLEQMVLARKIVELAHAARAEAKIKVRQPLSRLAISSQTTVHSELLRLIADEVNVKQVVIASEAKQSDTKCHPRLDRGSMDSRFCGNDNGEIATASGLAMTDLWITKTDGNLTVSLNTLITPELKKEGLLRELIRQINDDRKKAGLTPKDKVAIWLKSDNDIVASVIKENIKELRRVVLAKSIRIVKKQIDNVGWSGEADMGEYGMIHIGVKRDNN